MRTGVKLAIGGLVVAGVTTYMAYLGASADWQYYLAVDECLAQARALSGSRMRVSGKVAADSLQVAAAERQVRFAMAGSRGDLAVVYVGSPPDNLAEGMDVVVEGRLDASGRFQADKLLTRCASKYQSRPSQSPQTAPALSRKPGGR